jgi:hypothetical protein
MCKLTRVCNESVVWPVQHWFADSEWILSMASNLRSAIWQFSWSRKSWNSIWFTNVQSRQSIEAQFHSIHRS